MRIKLKPFSSRHLLCPRVTAYHRQSWSVHVKFCFQTVRNLGFILDSNLTMKEHVIKICQTAYYELERISSIRRYLHRCIKITGNFLCIVQIRLLQFSSHGHSQHCYSTDAESQKYCCTPYSQSTTPSELHTSPTATQLTNEIQSCLHVLQRNHRFHSLFLSYYTFTVLPALSALRQTHACSKSNASTEKPMAFALSHTLAPTSGTISPKTSGYSLFLQKQTEDISLFKIC